LPATTIDRNLPNATSTAVHWSLACQTIRRRITMASVKPIPDGAHTLTPYLIVNDTKAAFAA
jgi:hypothetical protein